MDETVRILLVDDESRNLDALESILDSSGCTLIRAQTADDALVAIMHHDFAAIVLDIKMPGTDGLELAQIIKQRKRSQHVPILFLTAHSLDEKEILQAYGVGAVDFLTKPINPEILRSKVAVFANLFRTTRALAQAVEALNAEVVEREKAQEELRLAKDQLESRVVERTEALAHADREIRDNEERLRLALAVAQVATWELDLATGKKRWSADPEVVFGFPPGSFGPDCRIFHAAPPEDIGVIDAALKRAMETGDFDVEFRAIRPDGSVAWIAERGHLIHDSENQSSRIVGISVDLTRRKVLEEELLESDHRKNEFLATLAHELRNPLAPVRYAIKVLAMKGPDTPQLRWAVDLIERQIQHMARLIDDLLDVNRISRNMLELRKEHIELETVIASAVETNRPLIEQKRHELIVSIPPEPIFLEADSVRLAQVLSNLLNNAAKYSKGVAKIWLTARQESDAVYITIKDIGVGIAPAMLPKIFDMFTQVGRSVGQSEGGLGIGLALAKRLVEMHGGTITARSEGLGKGSEFTIMLPSIKVQPLAAETSKPVSPTLTTEQPSPKRRILIADDNRDVVECFAIMLQTLGHEVQIALDGAQALEKAEEFRPDVMVLDIGMPVMDGYETARRVRERPWSQDVVLVAVTGWGNEKDKRQSAEAGFDVHLVKPVDATSIINILDQMDQARDSREQEQANRSHS